jgi:hypothetical protein
MSRTLAPNMYELNVSDLRRTRLLLVTVFQRGVASDSVSVGKRERKAGWQGAYIKIKNFFK